jgi:hypothetical protein
MSPFFANAGYHPRMSFGPPRPTIATMSKELKARNKEGTDFATKMQEITDLLRTNMLSAQDSQKRFADVNREPAPAYRVGDMVLLSTRNIDSARPTKKFDQKYLGPFRVEEVVNSSSYRLNLPFELELIHDTFHTSNLRPAPHDPLPGQFNLPPPPITIDTSGNILYAIEKILKSKRTKRDGFQYLIKWRGYDKPSWQPLHNVVNARASIIEFEKLSKNKKIAKPTKDEIKEAKEKAQREE